MWNTSVWNFIVFNEWTLLTITKHIVCIVNIGHLILFHNIEYYQQINIYISAILLDIDKKIQMKYSQKSKILCGVWNFFLTKYTVYFTVYIIISDQCILLHKKNIPIYYE